MNLQINGLKTDSLKTEESKNPVFDLLKSHIDVAEQNTLDKENFKDILNRFVNGKDVEEEHNQDRLRDTKPEHLDKSVGEEKNSKDKDVIDESVLEESIILLSSIKEYLSSDKKFDSIVKNIDKVIDYLKNKEVNNANLILVKNLLDELIKSKEVFSKEISGKESLDKFIVNLIEKINQILHEPRSNFVQNAFEANSGKTNTNILREVISSFGDKVANNSVASKRHNDVEERIKVFDFRKSSENSLNNSKNSDKEFSILGINKISFSQENNSLGGSNLDFRLENLNLDSSNNNLRLERTKNLSNKNGQALLGNVEQNFKKNVVDEANGKKSEIPLMIYTPIEFDKKNELTVNSTKATSFVNYFKLDFAYQLNQLAGTMIINLRNNVNEMKMTLFPPELGKVFVKFESTKDGRIVGNIVVSTKEAFTLFQEHLNAIKDTLQNQGFQFVDINLSMSNDNFGNQRDFSSIFGESNVKVSTKQVEKNYGDTYLSYPKTILEDSTISLYA
jgi:flagellar hook-length control protein FliK